MARKARFTITLSESSTQPVSVNYATRDGTATAAAGDYTPVSGTASFPAGETAKEIDVPTRSSDAGKAEGTFTMELSGPVNATVNDGSGLCTLPGGAAAESSVYAERFNWVYDRLHDNANGYFGPSSGANAFAVPRHVPEFIINEAPDYGGETVSETASFWVGLEAWKGYISGDWAGYNNCWNKIDQFYVPSAANQPLHVYNPGAPADYTPEGDNVSDYPRLGDPNAPKGIDPLANELEQAYGTKRMYLMHWVIDVEGAYGYRNGDGATKCVFINTYQRGMQESSFETITQPCWNDWINGGGPYGYEPLFTQGKQVYPAAPFDYGKKWSYTNAPDAEGRAVQWAFWAQKFAGEQGKLSAISSSTDKARKMGDYLRYNLFDKYFRKIGDNQVGGDAADSYSSCHFLINWYAAWGGEIPASGQQGTWSFRIGCSESHQGYQAVDAAYAMATGGGGMVPLSPSAGDIWKGSVYRQIEMIRWLQSPEGPIAGGVTNSLNGRYETATDGRQSATFYGMYYTYTPVWHDPPSNNWVGFQAWGQGRTADLFLEVSDKTTPLANDVRGNLEIILDRLVAWFLDEAELSPDGGFSLPTNLSWVSSTQVAGQTATKPNLEGVYEFLPSMSWDGSGDYAALWNQSSVPNPNLHCRIVDRGADLGVASSLVYLLITYAEGKRRMGKFTTAIPNSAHTPETAFTLAKELLDRMWEKYRDDKGICIAEPRNDYNRMGEQLYVPSQFTGTMPNGEQINQSSTYISIRSFLKSDPKWPEVQAYINGTGPAPIFTYHRFWAQAEYAIASAAMHRYFKDLIAE